MLNTTDHYKPFCSQFTEVNQLPTSIYFNQIMCSHFHVHLLLISFKTFCQKLSSWNWFLSFAQTFVPAWRWWISWAPIQSYACDNEVITSCSHFSCRLPGLSIWDLLECQMLEWHIPIRKKWLVYKIYHFRSLFSFFHSLFIYRIFSRFYSTNHNLVNLCTALLYKIFLVFGSMFFNTTSH